MIVVSWRSASVYLISFSPIPFPHQQPGPINKSTRNRDSLRNNRSLHYFRFDQLPLIKMNLFILIVALIPLFSHALTLSSNFEVSDSKRELTIAYHRVNSSITVEALSSGKLVGQACSSSLSSSNFAQLPIIFDVNKHGSGNLTVGPSTYRIHEDIKHSGGIICGRMFNNVEAAVSCIVTVPAELPLHSLSELELAKCISDDFYGLAKALRVATRTLSGPTDASQTKIVPIEPPLPKCSKSWTTEVLGDGDPHQNYYGIQLSVSDRFLSCPLDAHIEGTVSQPSWQTPAPTSNSHPNPSAPQPNI